MMTRGSFGAVRLAAKRPSVSILLEMKMTSGVTVLS